MKEQTWVRCEFGLWPLPEKATVGILSQGSFGRLKWAIRRPAAWNRFHRVRLPEPLPQVERVAASGGVISRLHAVTARCAIPALSALLVAFHAEAQDATTAGTLVSDVGVNAPIVGKITLHRVGRGRCGWENPPPDKTVACRGTYTENTPDAYFLWTLDSGFAGRESVLNYDPIDITAKAGEDYTASSGSLTIERGGYQSERAYIYFIDDSTDEHDETMAYQITVVRGKITAQDFVAFQIADNDDEPSLSIGNDSVAEDSGTLAFEVSLDAASGKEITVQYTTADGTATSGADYASGSGTLTFAAGDTAATIEVSVVDDGVPELDEDMTVTLSNAINATIGTGTGTGTILDTSSSPGVSVSDAKGLEDTIGDLSFVVTLNTAGTSEATVSYATADGTATAGSDYTASNGTATFPVGTTTFTINVPVLPDTARESNEDFILNLTTPANAFIVDGTATGTIEDDDASPEFSIGDGVASEGDGSVALAVSVGGGRGSLDLSVDYATSDLTATAGDDFTALSGTLTFAAGVSTATILIPLVDDSIDELDETFSVGLSNPVNATLAVATATATIRDNDDPPGVSVADAGGTEGSTAEFVVSLDAASAKTIEVDYDTSSGTARESADFTATTGTLTFAPGATRATISVQLADDALDEPAETFTMALDSAVGAEIDAGTATGTITDNDDEPTVSVEDATGTEGADADFVVELSAASGRDVTVDYATSDGTAVGGSDFVSASETLTIAAGTVGATVSVGLTDDAEDEDSETFDFLLTSPSNATVLDGSATGTIVDNDDSPMLGVSAAGADEGEDLAFEVTLDAASALTVTVDYGTSSGTALEPDDFAAANGTLTFAPGQRRQTVSVSTVEDSLDEPDETLELALSAPSNATLGGAARANGTIRDDDDPPALAVTDADGSEGGVAAFEVSLSATSGREVTVTYDAVDGTAIVGADLEATAGTLTFPPGTQALTVTVPLIDDNIDEPDETFELVLASPVHATFGARVGAGGIRDDDDPPELSLAAATATEGGTAAFAVTLTAASGFEVTVSYATSEGTANAPGDFAATSGVLTFAPGTVRRTVSVSIDEDALDEPAETFELALSMPGNATISTATATGTIVDNDDAPVLSVADAFAAEGATLAFAVELNAASGRNVRVSFGTTDGTADAADYDNVAGELTFAAGTTRRTVSVQLLEDDVDEPEETFTLSLSAPVNASVEGTGTAKGRIVDNDGAPQLTVGSVTATEGDHANFEVVLTGSTTREVTVNYATRERSAREGADYEAAEGTLTLGMVTSGMGEVVSTRTVPVALIDDTVAEPDESFEIVLSSPVNATLASGVATGTIRDNDTAPTLSVSGATGEEGGEAVFAVTLAGTTSLTVSVRYSTLEGTARAETDYGTSTGSLTFAPGETSRTVSVALRDDVTDEPDETFYLQLRSPVNATVVTDTGTGTIRDNDAEPSLSVTGGSGEEGGTVAFEVTLSGATDRDVAVDYATSDDTAHAGDDYGAAAGTLRFTKGVSARTVAVDIYEDEMHEPNEAFGLTLSSPVNATLAADAATGHIADNDGVPTLSIAGTAGNEGETVRFRVTLAGSGSQPVTVDYATAGGTASAGADYETARGTLTFAPGESAGEIPVRLLQDALGEPDENFGMRLSAAANATVTTGEATATIFDDDGGIPMLSAGNAAAIEGGVLAFAFSLDWPAGSVVTVDYRTANETAFAGADYTAASGTLTIDVGETAGSVEIQTLDDDDKELEERLSLHLSSAANASLVSNAVVGTILDNDVPPELAVEGGVSAEGEPAVFTVTLSGAVTSRVTVDFASVAGTALDGVDFLPVQGKLTFDAGTAVMVAVTTVDDDIDEPVETLGLSLSAPVNAELPVDSAISTIEDDDEPPALSIADASGVEGEAAQFPVTLSDPSGFEVTVAYSTSDGTAVAGADYEAVGGSLVFTPGETTATVSIPLVQDSLNEPDENFTVSLSNPANATLATATAEGLIIDDDLVAQLAVAGGSGVEGGTVDFRVTLDTASTRTVTVDYATAAETAREDADYEPVHGSLTFLPGESAKIVKVTLVDDDVHEDDETFALNLSMAENAAVSTASATGTIVDDDAAPELSITGGTAPEGGTIGFTVTLTGSTSRTATVDYATADGTAIADGDYEPVRGSLTFLPGESAKTVKVTLVDDDVHEDDETFALNLSMAENAAVSTASATGTIVDDDAAPELSITGGTAPEGGTIGFTVTLTGSTSRTATVDYATADGTAIADGDYEPVRGTLTFLPGESAKTVKVTLVDDDVHEEDETFALNLSMAENAAVSTASATGTIVDDDAAPELSITGGTAPEGGTIGFTVTLTGSTSRTATVDYATADGTAIADGDYEPVRGTLTFLPGESAKTVKVTLVDDDVHEEDETFALNLSMAENAAVSTASATGTIVDDDAAPELSITGGTAPEGGTIGFTVTLTGSTSRTATVDYATADGTAIADEDYEPVHGSLTFLPGESAKTVKVTLVDDDVHEEDETFALNLSMAENAAVSTASATGTIVDDDAAPELSITGGTAPEGGTIGFTVTLTGSTSRTATVDYATADGTAIADEDYAPTAGTLTFLPGDTVATFAVSIADDAEYEPEESFEATLSSPLHATLATGAATGTILDNDEKPPTLFARPADPMLCVGGDPVEIDLARHFDGISLRYSAASADTSVATVELRGSVLTVAPVEEGQTTLALSAANGSGEASIKLTATVVADPAELEAVESVLASIARGILTSVTGSVQARFATERSVPGEQNAFGEPSPLTISRSNRAQADAGAGNWNGRTGLPMHGARSGGWDPNGLPESQVGGGHGSRVEDGRWPGTANRRGMVPFSFDSSRSGSTGPAWAVWGRGDTHRFESGMDGTSNDGTLTAVHLGADARVGDWLAGVSVANTSAEADYRFERSVDACGGGGIGEGMVDAKLTSVHSYAGRRVGRGWLWAALGAGGGEASVERCETGQRNEADLSIRLAALGGRHPFAGGERIAVSVVEEISGLALTTGDAVGPVGDRSVTVGQARLGLEAAGVAPADCECSLATFVRASARGDWGDGATGTGLELATGVRYRNLPRRLGIDAEVRELIVHSAEDAAERSANLTFSILPRADGTGLQASLTWRREAGGLRLGALDRISPWTALAGRQPDAERQWTAQGRLGYGIARRGFAGTHVIAMPFVELDTGFSDRRGARFGVRHEFGDRVRSLVVEWRIEQRSFFASTENGIVLEAVGRF